MRFLGKLPVIVAAATLALQPMVVIAKPCVCRAPDDAANVRTHVTAQPATSREAVAGSGAAEVRSCCAQRHEGVATATKRVDDRHRVHFGACSLKNSVHALGECCCVTKAPESATPPSFAATLESPTAHWFAYVPNLAESCSDNSRLSALRFGSPAELAYSSHPTLSILYCVWRN